MYFDAVIYDKDLTVAYNGTPKDTRAYLERMSVDRRPLVHVMEGSTMRAYTVEQYLDKRI